MLKTLYCVTYVTTLYIRINYNKFTISIEVDKLPINNVVKIKYVT